MYNAFKRIMDFFICLCAFPFLGIIMAIVAIAIKLDDGGPVFYMAERIGKDSKRILMYKFRSMKIDAENIINADGSTYNAADDPRVTKVGKFIRETSIDELPQLLNVIKGEMSLIGPRASEWYTVDTYLPDEIDKMKVRPGITGYTQAYYRNSMSPREKRVLDAWYANNVSLKLDIKIFFKTIAVVLKRENVYSNPEETVDEAVNVE